MTPYTDRQQADHYNPDKKTKDKKTDTSTSAKKK